MLLSEGDALSTWWTGGGIIVATVLFGYITSKITWVIAKRAEERTTREDSNKSVALTATTSYRLGQAESDIIQLQTRAEEGVKSGEFTAFKQQLESTVKDLFENINGILRNPSLTRLETRVDNHDKRLDQLERPHRRES